MLFLCHSIAIEVIKKTSNYRSIVTDLFDGRVQSSVQCLTCNRVSIIHVLYVLDILQHLSNLLHADWIRAIVDKRTDA